MNSQTIDLSVLPIGLTYEDRYGGYLKVFKDIAENDADELIVTNAPASWVPLLNYLNCDVYDPRVLFDHDLLVLRMIRYGGSCHISTGKLDRTAVEVLCGFRPETTDALWKVDMQWTLAKHRQRNSEYRKEFIVTTNGSFHRPEVLEYLRNVLPNYTPEKRKVVLVPCAADKPYPSKMHQAVLDRMPDDFYLANVTGVLGIVPQDLWPEMPHYDSGLPYEWRLKQILGQYLTRHEHEVVVVYADFYSLAIHDAVTMSCHWPRTWFVNQVKFYEDYLDLLDPVRLESLEEVFKRTRREMHV